MKLRIPVPSPSSFKTGLKIGLSWLLVLGAQTASAQLLPADDFFDTGAQLYISNNIPLALTNVEEGLKIYPDDVKLQKLEKLLKQQQKKQQQQKNRQNQQKQKQQNQKQQSSKNDKNSQSKKQPDKKDGDKKDQQNQRQKPDEAGQNQNGETNRPPQKLMAGQMTPQEAKRLLDQQKDNEQVLVMKPQGKPQDAAHPVKDW